MWRKHALSLALKYSRTKSQQISPVSRRWHQFHFEQVSRRCFSTPLRSETTQEHKGVHKEEVDSTLKSTSRRNDANENEQNPTGVGGFMRGLIGGQEVAAEDAFVAQAKEQGVEIPATPLPRRSELVPTKRRKRSEESKESSQSIRDRIFGRFAGSAFMQGAFDAKERIAEKIDESDNPLVNMFRNLYDRVFSENEMAMVIREIREEHPSFRISEFLIQVESELVPKILGAYLSGERATLEKTCTDEAYAMLNASIRERETEGVVMDTNILDIGEVELTAGRVLEDAPVLIVTFNTQQINCLRDGGGNIVEGREDDIRAVYYAWAFIREPDYEDDEPTGGTNTKDAEGGSEAGEAEDKKEPKPWKLMEMVIRGAHSTI